MSSDWGTERRDDPVPADGPRPADAAAPAHEPTVDPEAVPASAPPPASSAAPAAVTGHVPPPIPPPVWPGGAPESVTAVPAARPRGRLLAATGIAAAVVVGIGLKFVLPLVVGGVVGSALGGAFGGPWDRLPSDVRERYEQRLEAAAGSQLEGLTDAQASSKVEAWLIGGYPRLEDAKLVRHLELAVQALRATDEATCAAFGRHSIAGGEFSDETDMKLVGALDQAATIEWVGLNVDAIEAELRGFPERVTVSVAESDALITKLVDRLTEAELDTFAAVGNFETTTDAETCGAIRSLYEGILVLDPAEKALMARIDVQP